jgi:site-specific recombinase XerD
MARGHMYLTAIIDWYCRYIVGWALSETTKNKTGRRNQTMLILYYDTAARISELLDLTVGNVHIRSETPHVTLHGKGGKYRNIPLMGKTVEHLKRYLREFHPDNTIENPMFYTVTHGIKHNLSADTVEGMLKKYAEICRHKGQEMPSMCYCHMLRKTRAMDLYQSGVPLTHIQQLLGHKDLSTTSGFYAFATLDTLAKSMAKTDGGRNSEDIKKWDDKAIFSKLYRL